MELFREEEFQAVLIGALSVDELWRAFATLFDRKVSIDNPEVTFIRSMMILAGPLRVIRTTST